MQPEQSDSNGLDEEPSVIGRRIVSQLQRLLVVARERIRRSRELLSELERRPPNGTGS